MKELVAIIAVLGVFFAPVAAVALIVWFYFRNVRRRNELKAEVYSKAIEKGVELPADLFSLKMPKSRKNVWLNVGITCIALGLSILLTFVIAGCLEGSSKWSISVGLMGLVPFVLGWGFLAIHFISKKQERGEQE
ncbi:MAG: DUF6249 domain-containing protein [Prevotellaceae bacterium]|jgi:ABC-type sugar transport system permease subunit|nr:DUF6249 domain-containing protein [Prevotellaceae bacterium]